MATLFRDDEFVGDLPTSDLIDAPSSGIGMAPQAAAEPSASQRVGRALFNFGSGAMGGPSWDEREQTKAREGKRLQLEETSKFIDDLGNLAKLTENMDDASKAGLIDTVAKKWDAVQPGYGAAVKAVGARPSLLTGFDKYLPHLPVPLQQLAKKDPKAFLRFAGTSDGMKVLNQAADQPVLKTAGLKRDGVVMGWQKLVPEDVAKRFNEDGVLTDAEILEMQQHLPEHYRFTPEERESIQRAGGMFWEGTGVLHGAKAQEVLADKAKQANKPKDDKPLSEIAKLGEDLKAKRITQSQYDARVKKLTEGPDSERHVADIELKIPDDYRQDTRKFAERRPLFETSTDYMASRKDKKTSAGDAALMFAYAKMRDPNDRIAVNDIRDLHKLGNIFERVFEVNIPAILERGETLPDRVANDMYAEIRRSFTTLNAAQAKVEKTTRDKILAYKGTPSRVIGEGLSIPEDKLKPKGDKPKDGEVEARKTIGQVNYVKIKGQWFEER